MLNGVTALYMPAMLPDTPPSCPPHCGLRQQQWLLQEQLPHRQTVPQTWVSCLKQMPWTHHILSSSRKELGHGRLNLPWQNEVWTTTISKWKKPMKRETKEKDVDWNRITSPASRTVKVLQLSSLSPCSPPRSKWTFTTSFYNAQLPGEPNLGSPLASCLTVCPCGSFWVPTSDSSPCKQNDTIKMHTFI